jgi:O-antigen ligase
MGARLYAIGPTAKLLMLPLLFYHFERSARGMWVFIAFPGVLRAVDGDVLDRRCSIPALAQAGWRYRRGIFVKNYIDQSQEFALCAWRWPIRSSRCCGERNLAGGIADRAIALSFVVNMAFVIVSRTALVTMPIMLAVFALLHLKWRTNVVILCAAIAWRDWRGRHRRNCAGRPTNLSCGIIRFTKNSISRRRSACGWNSGRNRCGSLPRRRSSDTAPDRHAGFSSRPPPGPRSGRRPGDRKSAQPDAERRGPVGRVGVVVLYAMWLVHLLLFRGEGLVAWIGLMVVVQNIFTSLFNSHLFDFHEGWMYVLGVGVAGGMVLGREFAKKRASAGKFPPEP